MEIQKLKQTVYLPVKVDEELPNDSCKCGIIKNGEFDLSYFIKAPSYTTFDHVKSGLSHKQSEITHWLKPKEAFVLTPEQLNQLLSDVIKDALDTVAENATSEPFFIDGEPAYMSDRSPVDKQSITNTFDITYQKHKV